MKRFILGPALATASIATVIACSHRTIEFERPSDDASAPPSFSSGDASTDDAENALISYCPSLKCTNDTTTCPGSLFPCDVDLMTDPQNCGACGWSCNGVSPCFNGKCSFTCPLGKLDCNGEIEDGCEVTFGTNDNCNACGDACTDPAKPCMKAAGGNGKFQCGCPAGQVLCGDGSCHAIDSDDKNCSACGQACDPNGPAGSPSISNGYYGCLSAECDQAKCNNGYSDCDDDPSTGCETQTNTAQNCGGCGITCDPGQICAKDPDSNQLKCRCSPGQTLCGDNCVDLVSDISNCGGCGISCVSTWVHGMGVCLYGSCALECTHGYDDCNHDPSDDCETNVRSDPNNCGGCGIHCSKDQACIGGRCAVEPCPDAGTGPQ